MEKLNTICNSLREPGNAFLRRFQELPKLNFNLNTFGEIKKRNYLQQLVTLPSKELRAEAGACPHPLYGWQAGDAPAPAL